MSSHPANRTIFSMLCLAVASIFLTAGVLFAKPRSCVRVELASDTHIGIPQRLRLRFTMLPYREGLKIPLNPDAVGGGAGLVVEHIGLDGTVTRQERSLPRSWHLNADLSYIEVNSNIRFKEVQPPSFDIWVFFSPMADTADPNDFNFSEPGVYQISYEHPWAGPKDDPKEILYSSNKLTVMPIDWKRRDQLHKMVRSVPGLELASYRFRNPPPSEPFGFRREGVTPKLNKAIQKAQQDFILYLLGSPDWISIGKPKRGCDQTWFYETSPVGGYMIHFHNGKVATASISVDRAHP